MSIKFVHDIIDDERKGSLVFTLESEHILRSRLVTCSSSTTDHSQSAN